MTTDLFLDAAVIPALSLMPSRMDSIEGRAMVLAIGLQESRLRHRRQIGGPARSYMQFEPSGIHAVLEHVTTKSIARNFCLMLDVAPDTEGVYKAIEWNDMLCAGFARMLLWTSPLALPSIDEPGVGWELYRTTWRPGRPRKETWNGCFADAWKSVLPDLKRGINA